jgi:signal transduction histidine kinase/CheY-like chemotaxis protein/HPt (histidine-containing phosphotransfer) domain-containing protein
VKGKVIISFLTAGMCVFLAWVVMNTVFSETLKTVDTLSKPNNRQVVVNRIFRSISKINQLQYVQYNVVTPQGARDKFMLASDKLILQLDSLSLFDLNNTLQQKRIDSMKVLINEHRKVYVNYIKLKADIIKNKTLSKRIKRLGDMVSQSSSQVDSNIITSRQKITTIIEPEAAKAEESKSQLSSFFNKLFGRKPKNETTLKKTITEEYNIKIDTLSLSQQDSLLKVIELYMGKMTLEQQRKGMRFIEKERALLASSNTIVNKLFSLIGSIKDDESALASQQSAKAAGTINQGVFRLNIIVLLFFGSVGILSLLIVFDITRSNKYKAELQLAKDEAERLTEVKQRFLSNMSHEIRTPLQSILGFSEQAKKQGKAGSEMVDAIFNSSTHLLQIVNEVLDYSRITSGKFTLIHTPFSLTKLMNEVEDVMKIHASAKRLKLYIEHNFSNEFLYVGDEFRLKQVLYNLIGNAIKFTQEGSIRLTATQHIIDSNIDVKFTIEDTGIGMNKQQLERVFNEFEQADSHIASNYGGTGLGLAIVNELVLLMDGNIEVTSEPGKGTVFTLHIPFKRDAESLAEAENKFKAPLELLKQPVWLADDDAYIRQVCSLIFEANHLSFKVFASANELLNAPQSIKAPVYVLDIRMPEINGMQLCQIIKSQNPEAIIIALTAQALPDEHEAILNNGFDAILTKPFSEKQLLDVLASVIHNPQRNVKYGLDTMVQFAQGDRLLLAKNIELLISESVNDVSLISLHLKTNNALGVADVLHRLSGRVGLAGALSVSAELRKLEKVLREATFATDYTNDIEGACNSVTTLLDQLKKEI